jgi:hypothetical protein
MLSIVGVHDERVIEVGQGTRTRKRDGVECGEDRPATLPNWTQGRTVVLSPSKALFLRASTAVFYVAMLGIASRPIRLILSAISRPAISLSMYIMASLSNLPRTPLWYVVTNGELAFAL